MIETLGRIARLVLLMTFFAAAASAQEAETMNEFWPEVDVFVPLTTKVRLMFLATVTKQEETRQSTEAQVGAHVDFLLSKQFNLRFGYRYGFSLAGEDPYKEHRIIMEQTVRRWLPLQVLLSDRNREDLRVVNGSFSARYRNRLTFEREFSLEKFNVTPYASGEIYYDSRFDTWNRNKLTIGIQTPLKRAFPVIGLLHPKRVVVLDLYFMRQNDSRSQPSRIRGVGVAFNIYL